MLSPYDAVYRPRYVPLWQYWQLGLGAAPSGAGGLGASRPVGDNELVVPNRVYTFRTWSKVPINPDREVSLNLPRDWGSEAASWAPSLIPGVGFLYLGGRIAVAAAGDNAWEAAERLGWRVAPPRGHASFWQNTQRQASPAGWQGYQTSLNITPTEPGVKGAALKWAARRVLSFMSGASSPSDVSNIWTGYLYERGVTEESPSLLRRAAEAVVGREATRTATELGREMATEAETALMGSVAEQEARRRQHEERLIYGYVGAGVAFLLGLFLATRTGSAKVERKAVSGAERLGALGGKTATTAAGRLYPGLAFNRGRRRRRNRRA